MRKIFCLFIILLLFISCSSAKQHVDKSRGPKTTLKVQNQNFLDMTIYILRSSQRVRLGIVRGLSTEVLVIPDYLINGLTSLRLLADPIGSRETPVSDEITVSPGDEIEMVIPN